MGSDQDNHAYQAGVGGDLFRLPLEELLSMEGSVEITLGAHWKSS